MKLRRKKQVEVKEEVFTPEKLRDDILREARIVSIPEGAANDIVNRVMRELETWTSQHAVITQADLERKVIQELAKYHADLAYVYQNRGKII